MTLQEIEGLGEVHLHRPSAIVSGVLVLVGVVECLVSLACITISAREACGFHSKGAARLQGLSEGHNRKERLYRWLGQQKTIFPLASSQPPPRAISSSVSAFVPLSSDSSSNGTPRKNSDPLALSSSSTKAATNASNASNLTQKTSSTHLTPTTQASGDGSKGGNSGDGGGGGKLGGKAVTKPSLKTSKTPKSGSGTQHVHYGPNSLPAGPGSRAAGPHLQQQPCPVHHFTPMMPPPPPHPGPYGPMALQHPAYGHPNAHPSMYYPHLITPMLPHDPRPQEQYQRPSHLARKDLRKKKERKLRYKVSKKEEKKKKKKRKTKKELTDEQIERTYTGLDRQIAEGFINTAMEPALSNNRAFGSSFEEEDSF